MNRDIPWLRPAAEYSLLVPASLFGILARLGLEAVSDYDGRIVFPLIWAQGVGCAIMGTIVARKAELTSLYSPLQIALSTGLAGSITTFSSWMLEGYESFSNLGHYRRGGLHDTVDGLAYTLVTAAVAWASVSFGKHCSSKLPFKVSSSGNPEKASMGNLDEADTNSAESARLRSNYIDLVCALIGIVFYAGALLLYFLGPHAWRHSVTFALLLGPPGTMLRYALSKLNAKLRWQGRFPIGTFIANMLATAVLAGVYAGQRSPGKGGRTSSLTVTGCNALYALQQGFCGCLSTVSTFVVEVKSIQRTRWKWIYAGGSVLLGHLLILAIVGGVSWSGAGLGQTC